MLSWCAASPRWVPLIMLSEKNICHTNERGHVLLGLTILLVTTTDLPLLGLWRIHLVLIPCRWYRLVRVQRRDSFTARNSRTITLITCGWFCPCSALHFIYSCCKKQLTRHTPVIKGVFLMCLALLVCMCEEKRRMYVMLTVIARYWVNQNSYGCWWTIIYERSVSTTLCNIRGWDERGRLS